MDRKNIENIKSNEKALPHSIEAEQSVLGGLMLDNLSWDKVAEILKTEDFYIASHQVIFNALELLANKNTPFDVLILSEQLKNQAFLDRAGGESYLFEIVHQTPSAANIQAYAQIVREKSVLRKIIKISTNMLSDTYQTKGKTADEILEDLEKEVLSINQTQRMQQSAPLPIQKTLPETLMHIERLRNSGKQISGLSTGFVDFDNITSGLHPAELIVIAGRPSMGKSCLAMNIAENILLSKSQDTEPPKPVLVFSMEMSSKDINMRMISSVSRINGQDLRRGNINDEDWERIGFMVNKVNNAKLIVDETPALTPTELRIRARRVNHEYREYGGLGLIIVDYLQLMQVPYLRENKVAEVSEISRSLKSLAKELNVPVVAISQLNRGLEQRSDKRPMMSDLRDSGSIEQDSDLIAFIYRDEIYNQDCMEKGIAEIIIAKQRHGPIGKIKLTYRGEYFRFENHSIENDFFLPKNIFAD